MNTSRRSTATSLAVAGAAALVAAGGQPANGSPMTGKTGAGARPSVIETEDGASLFYVDWGTGKPVLFTHAWALNADIWEYQLTELAEQMDGDLGPGPTPAGAEGR